MLKKILIALLVILVVIQFFRPSRNTSSGPDVNAIGTKYPLPADVEDMLKKSCYDCHSNSTDYPWYTNIQPVGWWMQHHVNEGKEELNFSEFASYEPKRARHKMKETADQIKEGEMPISSYTWVHKDASLSSAQKERLVQWADSLQTEIVKQNNLPAVEERPGPRRD